MARLKVGFSSPQLVVAFKKSWAFTIWIFIFVIVLCVGMFGTRMALPVRVKSDHFWHCWELAALGSTVVFNGLFYILGFFIPPRIFWHLRSQVYAGLFPLLMLLIVTLLIAATYISLSEGNCMVQLGLLFAVSLLLFVFDFIMAKQSKDKLVCDVFMVSVLLNDVPVCIAFLALLAFSIVYHPANAKSPYDSSFRAFIGGAIAFQMLLSNWVLALIFRKPGEWYKEESSAQHDEGLSGAMQTPP